MRTAGRETVHLYQSRKSGTCNNLYEYIIAKCKEEIPDVQTGIFGADMKISLVNDGPFTILLDSEDLA